MRLFFDTSVLVAAFVESHPTHERALNRVQSAQGEQNVFLISGHTLAELFAVLTRLPVSPRIDPELACRLIEENTKNASVFVLSAKEYLKLPEHVKQAGLSGGVIYDAILLQCAVKAKADTLITLNPTDFNRLQSGKQLMEIEQP